MVPACTADAAAHREMTRAAKIHPIERSLRMTTPLHTGAGCRRDGQPATVTLKPGVTTNTMLLSNSAQRGNAGRPGPERACLRPRPDPAVLLRRHLAGATE